MQTTETVCMKWQTLFSEKQQQQQKKTKTKKNINLLCVIFALSVVKVKLETIS